MTPAINAAKKANIVFAVHRYDYALSVESYGVAAAEKLAGEKRSVFKTLVVNVDANALVIGLVPVATMLSMKRLAKVIGAKKTEMAAPEVVFRSTGYMLGGVSPLGQKKRLLTVIDSSINNCPTVYVSAGRRGLEIELSPTDLVATVHATIAPITQ
jgi:Cys-tRNA(Pro)/Cys-tRNA(Cys) deacylase